MAPMLSHAVDPMTDCGFNQATPHPADPIECHRARREHRNPKAVNQCSGLEWPPLDLLENYTGSISKRGDRRVRTLLYEAANVMLTRYRGKLALKDWALAIGRRSTMRKARIALARRLAIIMHAMLRHGTEFKAA